MNRFATPLRSILCLLTLAAVPAMADTAQPSSTSATYGNWTVTCTMQAAADGSAAAQKFCQMTTRLNLKGNDGQLHPILDIAIGVPPGEKAVRMVLQVPGDVALRAPVVVSVDAANADATATPKPQTELLQATYFACTAAGCLADGTLTAPAIATLQQSKTTNVAFTAFAGSKKIVVPVTMTGFGDAWAALKVPAP